MLLNMESPAIKMVPLGHVSEVLLSLSILLIELTSLAFFNLYNLFRTTSRFSLIADSVASFSKIWSLAGFKSTGETEWWQLNSPYYCANYLQNYVHYY